MTVARTSGRRGSRPPRGGSTAWTARTSRPRTSARRQPTWITCRRSPASWSAGRWNAAASAIPRRSPRNRSSRRSYGGSRRRPGPTSLTAAASESWESARSATRSQRSSQLAARGILYVPDFLANCGGLIHVSREWYGRDGEAGLIARAMDRLDRAIETAEAEDSTPLEVAERQALERVEAARGRTRRPGDEASRPRRP